MRHLEHGGGAEPEIPATVRSLLAARIDALPEAEQDVLQHAAVVGRRFWPSALEPRWRDEPLAPILRSLERSGFIVARATSSLPGERELAFVHGLTREVAYRSIPRGARCRVHAAVAAWVEGLAGDRRDEYLDVLAHHYEAAAGPDAALAWPEGSPEATELRAAAVRTLVEAGEAARRRLSLAQALRYAERAAGAGRGARRAPGRPGAARQQPPRGGPRQPGARRLSRGDRARPRAGRRRGHRAPARLRDPAVQPLPGVVHRHRVEGARRRPRRPRSGGGGGGRRRLRDRRAAHRARVGDVALARSDRRGPAARQARRRARGADR